MKLNILGHPSFFRFGRVYRLASSTCRWFRRQRRPYMQILLAYLLVSEGNEVDICVSLASLHDMAIHAVDEGHNAVVAWITRT